MIEFRRFHIHLVVLPEDAGDESEPLLPLLSSFVIQGFGNGNAVDPGGQLGISLETVNGLMHLDELRERPDVERLSNRLWRRYGRRAFTMLEAIREDPSMGADVMDSADYLRVELHHAAHTEMITRTEDFLRRRSKISLVVPQHDWKDSPGLKEVEGKRDMGYSSQG